MCHFISRKIRSKHTIISKDVQNLDLNISQNQNIKSQISDLGIRSQNFVNSKIKSQIITSNLRISSQGTIDIRSQIKKF